ncbi:hypothetical protein DFJ74DRAFT_775061 [Hyaloraphidium curvatum]|nr:hypothetical protein DFJ74DRAFT_775061 [Hyaloraphidium curvatum]
MARLASAAVLALFALFFLLAAAPRASTLPNDAAAKAFCRRNFWTDAPVVFSTTTQTYYTTWTYTVYLPETATTTTDGSASTLEPVITPTMTASTIEPSISASTAEPSITASTVEPAPCTAGTETLVVTSVVVSTVEVEVTLTSLAYLEVPTTVFVTETIYGAR